MIFRFNNLSLDTQQYQLRYEDHLVPTEPQVLDLLVYLIKHRDRVVTRNELLENLWPGKVVTDAALSGRIKAIRKAVNDSGSTQAVIKTIHRRGYQFIAPLKETESKDALLAGVGNQPEEKISNDIKTKKPSILILPFTSRGFDPDEDYLSDAISNQIRIELCRFKQIVVIARDSSLELNTTKSAAASQKIQVEYVLEGSLQKADNRLRIFVQLLKQGTGEYIWAEQYDRNLNNIFELQDEIIRIIIPLLIGKIETDTRNQVIQKISANLSAYDNYLKANYHFNDWHGSQHDMLMAKEGYQKAIELDEEFSPAYAGLASVYLNAVSQGWTDSPEEDGEKAIQLARTAVKLDEHDSNAHLVLGLCHFFARSDPIMARAQIQIALSLNPNHYHGYCWGGYMCVASGKLEESRQCSQEAMIRSPLLPDDCSWALGFTEYLSQRYEQALEAFARISQPTPDVEACVAACHAFLGNTKAVKVAVEAFDKSGDSPGSDASSWRAYWSDLFKFNDQKLLDQLMQGVHKAGLIDTLDP